MKNILAIEIKDNKTVVTLTKYISGMHNLLMHKTYGSKPLASNVMYDNTIVDQVKNDLSKNGLLDLVDETFLTINTKQTYVKPYNFNVNYNTDIQSERELIINKIEKANPEGVEVIDLKLSDDTTTLTNKTVLAVAEMVPSDLLSEIKHQYNLRGIKITKVVSVLSAIENAIKDGSIKHGATFNILLEEKFTQLTTVQDGKVISSIKWAFGLTNIYDYISEKMNIDKNSSKTLFSVFGSIPPEDVVDNKVIHTRKHGKEVEIFTKKDLSKYITEKVNEIFADIKTPIDHIKKTTSIKIIFNGEIKSLTGFKKYAAKSFAEPNIARYNSRVIGLSEGTEFITIGILGEAKEYIDTEDKPIEKILTPKMNIFKKMSRMYNYI